MGRGSRVGINGAGSDGGAGASGADDGGGNWQPLPAEIMNGAAVAVGALFGEVAGAALQGTAEPLVRRAADWVAARRPAEQQVESARPQDVEGTPQGGIRRCP
ncbi:hypothetical protein [Streptomyces sp. NPDC002082]|uniref:hypothetical protein n=1 Tax=Streptomyces sp. NPDC002082 TaxID=3154772 RepID=UPI00331B42F4